MKPLDYYEVCSLLNKGVPRNQIEVKFKEDWIPWSEAIKVLKGLDFNNVKYRRKSCVK